MNGTRARAGSPPDRRRTLLRSGFCKLRGVAAFPKKARAPAPALIPQQSGTEALLIGTDAVSAQVAWASGTGGTVLRTTDGGQTWQQRSVPGPDSLQFRDVEAMSARVAYVLSIGTGAASRIYKTTDGGASWSLQFRNEDTQAFFDCMALWNDEAGFAFSDAISPAPDAAPRFPVITPESGGEAWTPVEPGPRAFAGEGSFAASGTCAATRGDSLGWIGSGNAAGRAARVLRTADRGRTWRAAPVPIDSGEGAGVTHGRPRLRGTRLRRGPRAGNARADPRGRRARRGQLLA
ncbi:MAG: oxidoreductase [Bacteroidetes bacterium QS_9_68_14]|nr:MAG: oxidoreductase [Bacteroidetes bacterium QS_9_68_14]